MRADLQKARLITWKVAKDATFYGSYPENPLLLIESRKETLIANTIRDLCDEIDGLRGNPGPIVVATIDRMGC